MIKLYQYAICPFCNKAKSALRYMKVPFETAEVNPLTKGEVKGLISNYTKVPIALFPGGEAVKESADIIEKAAALAPPEIDREHFLSDDARKWSQWVDREFAVCMYPNLTRSFGECMRSLSYVYRDFPFRKALTIQFVGGIGMTFAHRKILKKYNFKKGHEREYLYKRIDEWVAEVGGKRFRGGNEAPDVADLSVYGIMKGLQSLPIYMEIMSFRPQFAAWMMRMEERIEPGGSELKRSFGVITNNSF